MGQSTSKYNQEQTEAVKVDNIKKLFNLNEQNDILESLNLDLNTPSQKIQLPLIQGGGAAPVVNNSHENNNRYTKHDIFNLISSLEETYNQQGGDIVSPAQQNILNTSDDASMQHIKDAVLKELGQSGAGAGTGSESGCGCDKGMCDSQAGGKKKKSKKSRKVIENTSDAKLAESSETNTDGKNFSIYPYNSSDAASSNASERNFRMLRRKI